MTVRVCAAASRSSNAVATRSSRRSATSRFDSRGHGCRLARPGRADDQYEIPGPGQGTRAANINPSTAIAGRYIDSNGVSHGFLRALDGTITTFDAPNAGTGPGQGTIVFAVDSNNGIQRRGV